VPVYFALRRRRLDRRLLVVLAAPFGVCLLLLLAYNALRFGNPFEVGQSYNLAGYDPRTVHLSSASYILPNLWYYGISPPRPTILFPFLALTPPPASYPLGTPESYGPPEITGGLLTMTPILIFAFALPWLRRRRPQSVEPLASPLLVAAGAGVAVLAFLSFEFFSSTERYETDFAAVFLFAALAAWFALSSGAPGRRRRTVRILGAVLAVWSCLTGVAISFSGYYDLLREEHPGTWRTLENLTEPISTAIATLDGHPVLGGVLAPGLVRATPVTLTSIGAGVQTGYLAPETHAELTIVSPGRRTAALVAVVSPGAALRRGATLYVEIKDASSMAHIFPISGNGYVRWPIQLNRGVNRVLLTPVASATNAVNSAVPASGQLLNITSLAVAASYKERG